MVLTVDVAPELVGEIDPADVEQLARAAADGWTCAVCGDAGAVDGIAEVVLLREGLVTAARLAHPWCVPDAPVRQVAGLREALAESRPATATAGLAGDVPLLVVDLADTVAGGDPGGERVDKVAAHLLGLGLDLVADLARLAELGAATGWRAALGPDWLTLTQPDRTRLYDGELVLPDGWAAAAAVVGGCVLLVASGLGSHTALDRIGERLAAAARAGRLVGGVVPVI
ncbi:hypothetical protein [Actinomadura montaniterrae]|uniref:Uncharacterized protein n=1 Tax=Actinomadura montaniterrae TaxID=1803903 RepID=A0A6L3VSM1_9ACTN|nr:hypothetical protein [Actinomadura montaniterrae]KAB2376981.1 hypothetical protein F9B16_24410 [Actinomadura montaniterrae]